MAGMVQCEVAEGVARLTFDNPDKHNAMSQPMWQALAETLKRLVGDTSLRVLALTGAGDRAFVSGSDIAGFAAYRSTAEGAARYAEAVEDALAALRGFAVPTVALIRGHCIGGGVSIAAACDMRLTEAGARFAVPAGRLGVGYSIPQVAGLQQLVGPSRLRELIFTGRRVGAEEALAWGLVNEVLPIGDFVDVTAARLKAIAASAPLTLRAAKLASRGLAEGNGALLAEAEAIVSACFVSEDYREGQQAFADRRPPVFRGR